MKYIYINEIIKILCNDNFITRICIKKISALRFPNKTQFITV